VRVRVLGGGWYGCHLATWLLGEGHDVELHEIAERLFDGASGGNPARLHQGFHYPRSRLTRAACQDHAQAFMAAYGHLTRAVPVNLYAVAAGESLVDFGAYLEAIADIPHLVVNPVEFGLRNCEGAVMTGERHIVIDQARAYFEAKLEGHVRLLQHAADVDDPAWDLTLDCTFCANDAEAIDRYEPCVTAMVDGPTERAVTIMDGPFPSLYPWNPQRGLSSITSALHTPFSKTCRTYDEARQILWGLAHDAIRQRCELMRHQLALYWPDSERYDLVSHHLAIRAMPKSGADARLVDVVPVGDKALRVRAGKIDAVFRAQQLVDEVIRCL
jgi:hypothetical protein